MLDGMPLCEAFKDEMQALSRFSHSASVITPENVLQEKDEKVLRFVMKFMTPLLLEHSGFSHEENLAKFCREVESGKRGLILLEHYSNFDLPGFVWCLQNACADAESGKRIAERLISVAGMKLNEENAFINACLAAFSRIVIYPSRSLEKISDAEKLAAEQIRSRKINLAAMRALDSARKSGRVLLVFPSGTRYREGRPETKRGVPEIDSYLRLFDVMLLSSVNGNIVRISKDAPDDMGRDEVWHDIIRYRLSEPIDCKKFRSEVLANVEDASRHKQAAVDELMKRLDSLHREEEPQRAKWLVEAQSR